MKPMLVAFLLALAVWCTINPDGSWNCPRPHDCVPYQGIVICG